MDWTKYNQVPTEFATASEIGIAAATLGALARKGFVEVQDSRPKRYRRIDSPAVKVYQLCEQHKKDYDTYFTLRKKNEKLGMLCSISGGTVVDCWGKPYDLTNVCKIEFRTKEFEI